MGCRSYEIGLLECVGPSRVEITCISFVQGEESERDQARNGGRLALDRQQPTLAPISFCGDAATTYLSAALSPPSVPAHDPPHHRRAASASQQDPAPLLVLVQSQAHRRNSWLGQGRQGLGESSRGAARQVGDSRRRRPQRCLVSPSPRLSPRLPPVSCSPRGLALMTDSNSGRNPCRRIDSIRCLAYHPRRGA